MTDPARPPTLPLARLHGRLFVAGALLLLLPALVHAYLLMPFPGSQDLEAIKVAYVLERLLLPSRLAAALLLVLPVAQTILHGTLGKRLLLGLFAAASVALTYQTDRAFSAERMFREPSQLVFGTLDHNVVSPDALVLGVSLGGASRAYPIELIGYHHKVRDIVGGEPVLVTYCTMCRTGRVYRPTIDGVVQRFRLVGARHYNAILEDEQTGSWWYQATGKAVVGPRAGSQLTTIAYEQTTLRAWSAAHPETTVLQPDPSFAQDYADLAGYDRRRPKADDGVDPRWSRKSWVAGVVIGDAARAYAWDDLTTRRVIDDVVGGTPIVVAVGDDGLSLHAFQRDLDGAPLLLALDADGKAMVDGASGSRWTFDGACSSGRHAGRKLVPVEVHQEYWRSWKTFHPDTTIWTEAR